MGNSNRLGPSSIDVSSARADARLSPAPGSAKVPDEEAVKWAALLVQSLKPEKTSRSIGLRPAQQAQTGGQSQLNQPQTVTSGTAELLGSTGDQSQIADTGGVNEAVPNRLILNVDSETLGRVQLVVDRDEGGVRVLVGSDHQARSRLSDGKHAIAEALSAAAVRVGALRFVALNEVGTVLAQDLLSKKPRPETTKKDDAKAQDKGSKTKRQNLNLVG